MKYGVLSEGYKISKLINQWEASCDQSISKNAARGIRNLGSLPKIPRSIGLQNKKESITKQKYTNIW